VRDALVRDLPELAAVAAAGYVQGSLFGFDDPAVDHRFAGGQRTDLDAESWIEHVPLWMTGADLVFAELVARVSWRQRHVVMYNKFLPEPRLSAVWRRGDAVAEPLAVLAEARTALERRYSERFESIGFNYYRDGDDSVAWHGDRDLAPGQPSTIAILSVGVPRPFLLRPAGGGASSGMMLGQGDLLVMGGMCQERWEHCVPKIRQTCGPRISCTYRTNA
jgi:alkylated DNA repair dioxygenase AlkB